MVLAPVPSNERERLADVRALRILDTPAERRFDRIVELARRVFRVPIAYISLVDTDRQWFKARVGLEASQTPRDISFCAHAVLQSEPLIIPDATLDPRFADNPMVVGEPHVRFYAGHPLKGPGGHNIGTLCLVDRVPRTFEPGDVAILAQLAAMAEHELNIVDLIGTQRELLETKTLLVASRQKQADELADAAKYIRSMLPERLEGAVSSDYWFAPSSQLGGDIFGHHWLDPEERKLAVYLLDVTGHGVSAALLSISVYQSLRRQTLRDTPFDRPDRVLAALNAAFPMEEHGGKFFTIWYGVYDRDERLLSYASGGHPPPLLFEDHREGPRSLEGSDLIVGVEADTGYTTHRREVTPGSRVFVFSDGAFELRNPEGRILTYEGLRETLTRSVREEERPVCKTYHALRDYRGSEKFDDDVSLLELQFG